MNPNNRNREGFHLCLHWDCHPKNHLPAQQAGQKQLSPEGCELKTVPERRAMGGVPARCGFGGGGQHCQLLPSCKSVSPSRLPDRCQPRNWPDSVEDIEQSHPASQLTVVSSLLLSASPLCPSPGSCRLLVTRRTTRQKKRQFESGLFLLLPSISSVRSIYLILARSREAVWMHTMASHLAACVCSRAGTARSPEARPPGLERGWLPSSCGNSLWASHEAWRSTCGIKARTKEMLTLCARLGPGQADSSTALMFQAPSSGGSRGLAQIPGSSVRTRFKEESRLTDLDPSQSSLDSGTAVD